MYHRSDEVHRHDRPAFTSVVLWVVVMLMVTMPSYVTSATALELGLTMRVWDILYVSVTGLAAYGYFEGTLRPRFRFTHEAVIALAALLYFALCSIGCARGLVTYGSIAIGQGRFYFPGLLVTAGMVLLVRRSLGLASSIGLLVHTVIALSLLRLAGFFAGFEFIIESGGGRFCSSFEALSLAYVAVMLFPSVIDPRARSIPGIRCPVALFYVSLLLTLGAQHRSVWACLVTGLFYVLIVSVPRMTARQAHIALFHVMMLFALVTVGILALVITAPDLAMIRFGFIRGLEGDATGYWRVQGWLYSLQRVFTEHPIVGFGFGISEWRDEYIPEKFIPIRGHSQYVVILQYLGLSGLFSFLLLVASLFHLARTNERVAAAPWVRGLATGLTASLAGTIGFMIFYDVPLQFWLIAGGLLLLPRLCVSTHSGATRSVKPQVRKRALRGAVSTASLALVLAVSSSGCAPYVRPVGEGLQSHESDAEYLDREMFQVIEALHRKRLETLMAERRSDFLSPYRVTINDILKVRLYTPQLTESSYRVAESGNVLLPLLGRTAVEGKTVDDIEQILLDRLHAYYTEPEVAVEVGEYRGFSIVVLGAVQKPGVHYVTPDASTLLSLLAVAGAVPPSSSDEIMLIPAPVLPEPQREISREESLRMSIDAGKAALAGTTAAPPAVTIDQVAMPTGIIRGEPIRFFRDDLLSFPERDVKLHQGDTIVVGALGKVVVDGAVTEPGIKDIVERMTITGAIAAAHGFAFGAGDIVQLIREVEPGDRRIVEFTIEELYDQPHLDVRLRSGDVVRIPNNPRSYITGTLGRLLNRIVNFGIGAQYPLK